MESPIAAYFASRRETNRLRINHLRYLTFMIRRASFRKFLSVMLLIARSIEDENAADKFRRRLHWINDGEDEIVFPPPPLSTTPESRNLGSELYIAENSLCYEYFRWICDAEMIQRIIKYSESERTFDSCCRLAKLVYKKMLKNVKDGTLFDPIGNVYRRDIEDMDELVNSIEEIIRSSYQFPN